MNLAEFGSWALAQKSVANPTVGTYKGQCVSLIQQYLYQVFDKPYRAYGNAKDWAENYPKEYFDKLPANTKLQEGDVLVYGSNYGHGYGHIALIDINMKFFDQNGIKSKMVSYQDNPFNGYICVLRPKNQEALGLNKGYRYAVGQVCTTQVNLKVRDGAGTGARWKNKNELSKDGQKNALNQEKAVLKAGTKVTVKEIKTIGNDTWIRIPSGWIAGFYGNNVYVK